MQTMTPDEMTGRGWLYMAPCEPPQTVAALRKRLAEAEARAGNAVVKFKPRNLTP
jgi:hypothetical protein